MTMAMNFLKFRFFVWKNHLMTHTSLEGFETSKKMESLCDSYPPASLGYHSFASHYFMMFEELNRNQTDSENSNKKTVLMDYRDAKNIWVEDFQKYSKATFPKMHFQKLDLPQGKKMIFHEQMLFFLAFIVFFGIAFLIRKQRSKTN
jgi:hypothetical protein